MIQPELSNRKVRYTRSAIHTHTHKITLAVELLNESNWQFQAYAI